MRKLNRAEPLNRSGHYYDHLVNKIIMDEAFRNTAYKLLELFLDNPIREFSIRGIARDLKLSHATIIKHIEELVRLSLVKKKEQTSYPTYYANTESPKYKHYKKSHTTFKIRESGLIENIQKSCLPNSIILFGSCAKGTDTEESDIDIFVEAKEFTIDVSKYEKRLNKGINLLFETDINQLSNELRNNLVNGIILYGFVKVNGGM